MCEYMYMIILDKIVMSSRETLSLAGFEETSFFCCDLPYGEDHVARTEGSLLLTERN